MSNLYEKIGVSATATKEEITSIWDTQYNQVRRLVNHHDPNIVNQANQALATLEQVRFTLLDEGRRKEYDASLGIGENIIAGVADPLQTPVQPPNSIYPENLSYRPDQGLPGWICQHCEASNPKGTLFCTRCGETLGRICPNCKTSYEAKVNYCPSCGIPYEAALKQNEINAQLISLRTKRYSLEAQDYTNPSMEVRSSQYLWTISTGWVVFLAITSALVFLSAIIRLIFSLFPDQALMSPTAITIAKIFHSTFLVSRWAAVGITLGVFYFFYKKRKGIQIDTIAIGGLGGLLILAMLVGKNNYVSQILYGSTNSWLIFPAIVSVALFSWGVITTSEQSISRIFLDYPSNFLRRFQPVVDKLVEFSNNKQKISFGVGIGLSSLIFLIGGRTIFTCFLISIIGAMTSLLLFILSSKVQMAQSNQLAQLEKSKLSSQKQLETLISEISSLESELASLATSSIHKRD